MLRLQRPEIFRYTVLEMAAVYFATQVKSMLKILMPRCDEQRFISNGPLCTQQHENIQETNDGYNLDVLLEQNISRMSNIPSCFFSSNVMHEGQAWIFWNMCNMLIQQHAICSGGQ